MSFAAVRQVLKSLVTALEKKNVQSSRGVSSKGPFFSRILLKLEPFEPPSGWSDTFLPNNMLAFILYSALLGLVILLLRVYLKNPYVLADLKYLVNSLTIGTRMVKYARQKPFYSILDCFLDKVAKQPQKTFVLFEGSSFTYSQADKESNRAARALLQHANLKEGDTVTLFMENEPNFVWLWLALYKLGCTVSFLNSNIRSKSLLHCFSCLDAKVLIAGAGKLLKLVKGTLCLS